MSPRTGGCSANEGAASRRYRPALQPSLDRADQFPLQHTENGPEVMSKPQNPAVHADYGIGPLTTAEPGAFLDTVERQFGRAAEDGEDGDLAKAGDAVVTPLASGDHAPVYR